jgi:ribosomal protein S21
MSNLPIELSNVRVFDVLRNLLSAELGVVVGVEGDKIDLVDKKGVIVRFKLGGSFVRVSEDEAIAFRALTQALRRERLLANPRKKRPVRKPSVKRKVRSAKRRP